ncbi:CHAT domain-containing protein [Streptomyces sp. NPDC102264]|uniref:CHAT domain-containing protein n=1 Tax=Streptomyces sp. NPDC102264 TaxID=3366149 RepID=UPI00382668A6
MGRGIRRFAVWGPVTAVALAGGGVWGHWLVGHRSFRSGPHDQPVYDAEHNAVYRPDLGAWFDFDTATSHSYMPDSPLSAYSLPFVGAVSCAFFVLSTLWAITHRRMLGQVWLGYVRRPTTMLPRYLLLSGIWISGLAVVAVMRWDQLKAILTGDTPTTVFFGAVVAQLLLPFFLVYLPWQGDRLLGLVGIYFPDGPVRSRRGRGAATKQDALRGKADRAERFRLSTSRDFSALAWSLKADALIGLMAERGNDTDILEEVLRDGPAALGAPRHFAEWFFAVMDRPGLKNVVARAFMLRYEWTGTVVSLERAIDVLTPMAAWPRPRFWLTSARWRDISLNLARALTYRYELRGDTADLEEALALVHRVGRRFPSRVPDRLLELQFLRYLETKDPAALTAAVEAGLRAAPDPRLVRALVERFRLGGDRDDLVRARALAERLVAENGPGAPAHAVCLTAHAQVLAASGETDAAAERLRAAASGSSSPLQVRLAAATDLGDLGAGGPLSAEGYGLAVELLPQLAWIGLRRDDQRWLLRRWQGVPTSAAAAAIAAGQVKTAIEILDHGRAVMWGQLARLRDGAEIARAADPVSARRLDEIRAELDMPETAEWRFDEAGADVERRVRLGKEWHELSARLALTRRHTYEELSRASVDGPVVVVNTSPLRCDAMVLLPDDEPVLVPLDGLEHAELVAWARQSADPDGRHQAMLNVIAPRLWDDLAVPVLRAVAPHLGETRRIWWCPTGPLAALPLHAAGHHSRPGGPALLDEVVSSYTPTVSALLRSAARVVTPRGGLAVAARRTPGRSDLPAVDEETEEFLRCFPGAAALRAARVDDVLARLRDAHWVHVACHADATGLAVTDGVVSLEQLADLRLAGAEFCYLSACSTAAPDPRAYDEAVHMAALLHLQSFVHVVGTLWEIDSDRALHAAREVYRTLTEGGAPDGARSAWAVHAAARSLRRLAPDDVDVWSSLLHIGP